MPPLLELRGITKRFPGVLANDSIDLELNEGEILALTGGKWGREDHINERPVWSLYTR